VHDLGKGQKIKFNGFPLYRAKIRINPIWRLALNVVQYYKCETEVYNKRRRSHSNCSFSCRKFGSEK